MRGRSGQDGGRHAAAFLTGSLHAAALTGALRAGAALAGVGFGAAFAAACARR